MIDLPPRTAPHAASGYPARIVAIDFEASCLPCHGRSFPIEVGICEDGQPARSWLIRPHADWDGWDWTGEAQNLHGLTRDRILRDGLPPAHVIAELDAALRGARVVADSELDQHWLYLLAKAGGVARPRPIEHIAALIDEWGSTGQDMAAARTELDRRLFARHRAGDDAAWLAAFIAALRKAAAARAALAPRTLFLWPGRTAPAATVTTM